MPRPAMASDDLRARALRLLARREHTRQELAQKLASHCTPEDDLEALLQSLTQEGYLSDARAADAIARARMGRHGSLKLAQEFKRHGVPPELAEPLLAHAREGEREAATELWRRKFGTLPGNPEERARQGRYLQNRGFSLSVIRQVLRGDD